MARVKKVILLTEEDYYTLYTEGSIEKTIGGETIAIQYDVNNLHFTDYISSEMIDDSNSSKKFLTAEQQAQLASLPTVAAGLSSKQDTLVAGSNIKNINGNSLVGSGNLLVQSVLVGIHGDANQNIKDINGANIMGSGTLKIDKVAISTTAPTSANTSGYIGIAVLESEPQFRYDNWFYIITG